MVLLRWASDAEGSKSTARTRSRSPPTVCRTGRATEACPAPERNPKPPLALRPHAEARQTIDRRRARAKDPAPSGAPVPGLSHPLRRPRSAPAQTEPLQRADAGGRGRGGAAGGAADVPAHRAPRGRQHLRQRHQEAARRRVLHGRFGRAGHQEGPRADQGHQRAEGGEAAGGGVQDDPDGLHHRDRGAPAAPGHLLPHHGRQGARWAAGRRHGDRLDHRDLRRVPDRQDAAMPHALRHLAAPSGAGRVRGQGDVH